MNKFKKVLHKIVAVLNGILHLITARRRLN